MHFINHPQKKPSQPGNAARQLVAWHPQQRCSVRAAITLCPISSEQTCCNEGVIGKCSDL